MAKKVIKIQKNALYGKSVKLAVASAFHGGRFENYDIGTQVERITESEILAGMHDYEGFGREAKCRFCGRLAIDVAYDDVSPGCKGKPVDGTF